MNSIPHEPVAETLVLLLREAFLGPPDHQSAMLLNRGGGLLTVLDSVSAETASRAPADGGATIAAHTRHIRYYLDVLRKFLAGTAQDVDWEGSWSIQELGEAEWAAERAGLRADYEDLIRFIGDQPGWEPRSLGICLAMLAHTTYHLGGLRQVLRSVS